MTTIYRTPTFAEAPGGMIGCYFDTFPPTGEASCDMTSPGNWNRDVPYEHLLPPGQVGTPTLWIYQAAMANWGVQEFNGGAAHWLSNLLIRVFRAVTHGVC